MGFTHGYQFSQEEVDFILDNYNNCTAQQLTFMMRGLFNPDLKVAQVKRKIYDLTVRKRKLKKNFGLYTPEMCTWLKEHYNTMKFDDLTAKFNEVFNLDFTKSALWHKLNRIIDGGIVRDEHKMISRVKWTDEMIEWLKEHYEDDSYNRVAIKMNSVFNVKVTGSSLEHKVTRLGLKKSKESIKRNILLNKFTFQKGHIPLSKKPIGYERIQPDGYTFVKVAQPDVFISKQRVVYEQYYGPIPKGMRVIFADGNKQNFDINNLLLVTNGELATMNNSKLICKDYAEATKCELTIAKIKIKIRSLEEKYGKK